MALLHVNFFSTVLGMSMNMDVILPQQTWGQIGMEGKGADGKVKTMYLLHGMSDDHTIWQRRTSIERYASKLEILDVHFSGTAQNLPGIFPADVDGAGGYPGGGAVHGRLWGMEAGPGRQ